MGKTSSPFTELVDFKIFSQALSTIKNLPADSSSPRPKVVGVGSSECEDLSGDRMLLSAMNDMSKFSVGSAIWMNHRYDVPDDIFGALGTAPEIERYEGGGPGILVPEGPYWGVKIEVDVARNNEKAMKSYRIIDEDGVRLGLSIGCQVTDYEVRKDEDGTPFGLDIAHIMPYEWSLVGIPCNQQSWIQNAVKGIFERYANVPKFSSAEEASYIKKNFRDFDEVTALFIYRSFDSNTVKYLQTQNSIYKKYGLTLSKLPYSE